MSDKYWYNDEVILMIQSACLLEVHTWKPRIFSWPLDGLSCFPWAYQIHCAIVDAWNKEGRQTNCAEFHLKWLADIENVRKALS